MIALTVFGALPYIAIAWAGLTLGLCAYVVFVCLLDEHRDRRRSAREDELAVRGYRAEARVLAAMVDEEVVALVDGDELGRRRRRRRRVAS